MGIRVGDMGWLTTGLQAVPLGMFYSFGLNVEPWFVSLGAGSDRFPSKHGGICSGALVFFGALTPYQP